jgi:hypothetical protein
MIAAVQHPLHQQIHLLLPAMKMAGGRDGLGRIEPLAYR